jgi:glycosyltransferase involved in cell wall biosynthesis
MTRLNGAAKPKVSVCLITFQQEALIAQAIESVLSQATPFEVEVVIGEDASTDGTRAIVMEYARRFPAAVRLVLQAANRGLLRNFIDTFRACHGEYIALLDGDDYWTSPDKLARQAGFLDQHPDCSMCFHNVAVLLADGTFWEWNYNASDQKAFATIEDLLEINPIATCSAMIRRSSVPEFPSWYETMRWEDWPLYMLLAEHGRIGYLPEIMGVYRNHGRGLWSGLAPAAQLEAKIEFLVKMDGLLGYRHRAAIGESVVKYREELSRLHGRVSGRQGLS